MAFAFHKRSPEMVSTLEKSDPDGQDPPGKRRMEPDHAVSTNKHLTRLVRFSILQARRSSQSPKAGGTPTSGSSKPPFPVAGVPSPSRGSSNHRQRSPSPRSSTPPSQQQQQSPSSAKYPFAFGSFPQDKERPSTEVQYPYNNDAPGQVISQTGMVAGHVVDVPADPPIVVDLSASLTLSVGDEEDQRSVYSGESISDGLDAISAQEDHDHDDMDLLLAPDSGSADGHLIMNENSSDEVYNSAEMYSSSGNYEGASQSSGMSSTSDSIMRRVEQEIANARKASNDAQARLAYFTQKQKELTPVMTDSYSFDFENLETSGDLHNMLDVGSDEAATPRHQNNPSAWSSLRDDNKSPRSPPPPGSYHHASRSPPARNYHFSPRSPVPAQHAQEDSYNNAMGVIGREFDTSSADVEEKVDIEVVLAPSHNQNPQQRDDREPHPPQPPQSPTFRGLHAASKKQQRNTPPPQRSPRVLSPGHQQRLRSPRGQLNMDDSVDIDEAVISAVFSEKSIESLPIKESLHEVFSEPSMDSLPTQPTQSSIERPGSIDASYTESQSRAMSPSSLSQRKQQFMLSPNGKNATSPSSQHSQQQQKQQRSLQSHLSIETSGSASIASPRNSVCSPKANSVSSPLSNVVTTPNSGTFSPGRRSSKLPSTPRDPGTPSYRERLENKLKILGSRYPSSPPAKSPNSKKDIDTSPISHKKATEPSPPLMKSPNNSTLADENNPSALKDEERTSKSSSPPVALRPKGGSYDGLETRIKDLLARTLQPTIPAESQQQPSEKDIEFTTSPSAELKAIKKLLEQGVASTDAKEGRKRGQRDDKITGTPSGEVEVVGSLDAEQEEEEAEDEEEDSQTQDLTFPELVASTEEGQELTAEASADGSVVIVTHLSTSRSHESKSDENGIRLLHRSTGPVPAVLEPSGETKETKDTKEPSVTCSTSEEILEHLDSFSQSNEFKIKSKRSSKSGSPRSSPTPEFKECDGQDSNPAQELEEPPADEVVEDEFPSLEQSDSKPKKGTLSALTRLFERKTTTPPAKPVATPKRIVTPRRISTPSEFTFAMPKDAPALKEVPKVKEVPGQREVPTPKENLTPKESPKSEQIPPSLETVPPKELTKSDPLTQEDLSDRKEAKADSEKQATQQSNEWNDEGIEIEDTEFPMPVSEVPKPKDPIVEVEVHAPDEPATEAAKAPEVSKPIVQHNQIKSEEEVNGGFHIKVTIKSGDPTLKPTTATTASVANVHEKSVNPSEQSPSDDQSPGEQGPSVVTKKTPSVLNAALCRPSTTDNKDRKIKQGKNRKKYLAKKAALAEEEKLQAEINDTTQTSSGEGPKNLAVNASSSEASVHSGENTTSSQASIHLEVNASSSQASLISTAAVNATSSQASHSVKASSSQASVHSREQDFVSSTSSAGDISDSRPSVSDDVHDYSYDADVASDCGEEKETKKAPARVVNLKEAPSPPSHESHEEPRETPSGDKNMLASIMTSSSTSQTDALPPKPPLSNRTSIESKGVPPIPPGNRVKTVSLQAPPTLVRDNDRRAPLPLSKSKTSRQDRKIRFRDPYPTPKPCRKPRSTEEIQRDYSCRPTKADKKTRWKEPKGDLKRLLVAALDSSLSRRSNACGALKVISKLEKNKVILVRTTGFLEALVFVATDEVSSSEPDAKEDARARAISCIYNVSHAKENRVIVCTHPGLLECLVRTINEDRGEARMEACGVLAQLAKSAMCRDVMVDVEELLSTLASVLKGTIDPEEKAMPSNNVLSQDITEEVPSSYSEMSSVLSEEHIPFPKNTGSPSSKSERYDMHPNCSIRKQKSEMYDQYYDLARLSACAALVHLSKQCSVMDHFCSNVFLLESIIHVARDFDSKLHGKCLEILCNVSRLPGNTTEMTRFPALVDTLLRACTSTEAQDRVWALRTLQNMSSDAASKSTLATSTLLTLLINCVTSKKTDEQHAAMATLLNLSTDPSAVVPITSTKNVLATLVYLAHNADSTSDIRRMACNALATVGLWLQTVSGFGSIPEETRRVLLPSHKTTGWEIWD